MNSAQTSNYVNDPTSPQASWIYALRIFHQRRSAVLVARRLDEKGNFDFAGEVLAKVTKLMKVWRLSGYIGMVFVLNCIVHYTRQPPHYLKARDDRGRESDHGHHCRSCSGALFYIKWSLSVVALVPSVFSAARCY
jgi:hypothetical protein